MGTGRCWVGRGIAIVFAIFLVVLPAPASAFQEPNGLPGLVSPGCSSCHDMFLGVNDYFVFGGDCTQCHADIDDEWEVSDDANNNFEFGRPGGPHNGYLTTTNKCRVCHAVHNAPAGGIVLLPAATIYGTCFTCHDGTGGWGVYGAIAARGGTVPDTSRHGIRLGDGSWSSTNIVPGGNPADGGDLTGAFSGAGGVLMCNDCHSPHDADTVNPFFGDRARIRQPASFYSSSKLLKRLPTGTGAVTPVDDYGSGWCLTCHAGRSSGGFVHNHPAQTVGVNYSLVARLVSNNPTGLTEMGPLGGLSNPSGHTDATVGADNRGFLMPWPRTPQQAGRAPICQQCHEDSRSVGTLDATGAIGDAATAVINFADGVVWNGTAWVTAPAGTINPMFQNFPHETANPNMLVETGDDLCLNCHPSMQLP